MATAYVLYHPKVGNGTVSEVLGALEFSIREQVKHIDVTKISDYRVFLGGLEREDCIVLCGGDGTLNRFVNDTDGIEMHNPILCFPIGTGNDFARDLGYSKESDPFPIAQYLQSLPQVTVKNKAYRFINGIGFGIDGYCCEEGDRRKEIPGKKVNYTSIAIKGLLFHYKPTNARITVDGRTYIYRRVWLAPTMNGRFYGGGMMPTPAQKRNSGRLSTMVFHNAGKLRALTIFPSIFSGKHVKHKAQVEILTGREIKVEFDRPVALQIDGETVKDVTSYTATAFGAKEESAEERGLVVLGQCARDRM